MSNAVEDQLVKHLSEAHAMEKQALVLLERAANIVGDEEIARIYRAHGLQTKEHERYVAERLEAHGESPSKFKDVAMQASALGIGVVAQASSDTPVRLATSAFAFENLEIAAYRLIERLAERAGDADTLAVAERILEQEESAAELVAGMLERSLEITLGEPGRTPLPPLTPLGRPSERPATGEKHQGPQSYKQKSPDEPVSQPPDIESPTDELRERELSSPERGYPAEDVDAYGHEVPSPIHPERIAGTTADQQGA
jgi:ferritin-like metal-binding protein YciE